MTAYFRLSFLIATFLFSQTCLSQPVISSFSPTSGLAGTTVTINGTSFSNSPSGNIVFFGAVKATVLTASASTLTVSAPSGATYQPITVTVNGFTGYSVKPFIEIFIGGMPITQFPDQSQNTFARAIDSTTDPHPYEAVIADFDGDGKPDVATANFFSISGQPGSVSLLRNIATTGEIAFARQQSIPMGTFATSIAAGDLNGDGKPDMVTYSITDQNISIFKNTSTPGSIAFAPKLDIGTFVGTEDVAIADIDKDGLSDIVIINRPISALGSISILRNISSGGNLGFSSRVDFPLVTGSEAAAISDYDGDGKVDIALSNQFFNSITLLRNTSTPGTLSIASPLTFATGVSPVAIASGDLDGDGKPDIAVVNSSNDSYSIFRNTSTVGNISFAAKADFSCANEPMTISIGDVNGDGKPDIITCSDNLGVSQNNSTPGNVAFSTPAYLFPVRGISSVAIGDFTGDGKPDMVGTASIYESVSFFRNKNNEPGVRFFTPTTAATGATVNIVGNNFTGATAVNFGGVAATSFSVVNNTTINAVVGSGISGSISVTNAYGTGQQTGFVFAGPPVITSFTPTAGGSGTTVTITGINFTGATSVSFGGFSTSNFTVQSPTTIIAVVGQAANGNVSVTTPYGTGSLGGFIVLPGISSFSPMAAATGATITINGSNFTGATGVSFGGTPAASFTIINQNQISAVVGNGSSGSVFVSTSSGSGTLAGFTYIAPPVINSFTPVTAGAGATITISGANFTGASVVRFGNMPASSFSVVNSTTINAIIGSGVSGNVTVVTPGGTVIAPGFVYVPLPMITSFLPTTTGIGGTITIKGQNLSGATSVKIGGISAASFTVVDASTITAVVGGDASGDVTVTTIGGTVNKSYFFYTSLPIINSFSPGFGAIGTAVTISGANFNTTPANNIVYFGPVKAIVSAATANALTVIVPAGATYDAITVTTANGTSISGMSFNTTFAGGGPLTASSFSGRTELATDSKPRGIATGDFDGDGKPDIVVANYFSNTISVHRNLSTPNNLAFAEKTQIEVGNSPYEVAAADIDGDGKLDLISLNDTHGSFNGSVYRNTSTGGVISFEAHKDFVTNHQPCNIVICDLNADGKPDIAMPNANTTISEKSFITYARNESIPGNISLYSHNNLIEFISGDVSDNETPRNMDRGDFNGDGFVDLIVGYSNSFHRRVTTILKNSSSTRTRLDVIIGPTAVGAAQRHVSVGDFDGDGVPDFAEPGAILRNNGNFDFQQQAVPLSGLVPELGDLNGDGKVDYLVANQATANISAFENTSIIGTASFKAKVDYDAGNLPWGVIVSDLDADGKPEIISSHIENDRVVILKNRFGYSGPLVTSFTPASGISGTTVQITGTGFVGITSILIGGVPATSYVVNSSTSITAIAGTGISGNVSVISAAGTESLGWFTFIPPPPTITSFNPVTAAYGATITITGTNFREVSGVKIGGVNVTSYNVVSPTSIKAILNTGATGSVQVTTLGGIAQKDGFIFIPSPRITSFSPVTTGEGAVVIITGTEFTGATAVSFGGIPAQSFTVVSPTSISAVVGAGATGYVRVTTPGGVDERSGFTFVQSPVVTSFSPTTATSGMVVLISGKNFTGATAVSFGGVAAQSFNVNSSTSISAWVGTGATGDVKVTASTGTGSLAGFVFTFPTGIGGPVINNSEMMVAFPNPGDGRVMINHPASVKDAQIIFYDITGREVLRITPDRNSKQTETDVSGISSGVYQILWTDGTKKLNRTFMVK